MRYQTLDAWRGLLALLVALYHLDALSHFYGWPIVARGGLAVDFFFVLSGFVITHAYGERLGDAPAVGRFTLRRFGRLWPLHVVMLGVMIVLECGKLVLTRHGAVGAGAAPFTGETTPSSIVTNLFLLQAMGFEHGFTWNGPSWSISAEFWTYLVFAAVVWLLPRRLLTAAAAVIAAAAAAYLAWKVLATGHLRTFEIGFARSLYGFFLGHLTYKLVRGWTPRLPPPAVIEGAVLLAALLFWSLAPDALLKLLGPPLFAVMILVFAREAGPVSRLMRTRPAQLLGELSYSIYMVHFAVLAVLNAAARVAQGKLHLPLWGHGSRFEASEVIVYGGPWAMDGLALAFLAAVLACSWVTYRLVEVPGRSFFNELARGAGVGAARSKAWADLRGTAAAGAV